MSVVTNLIAAMRRINELEYERDQLAAKLRIAIEDAEQIISCLRDENQEMRQQITFCSGSCALPETLLMQRLEGGE